MKTHNLIPVMIAIGLGAADAYGQYLPLKEQDPYFKDLVMKAASKKLQSGDKPIHEALKLLIEAREISKEVPGFEGDYSYRIGILLAELGRNDEAFEAFRQSIAWDTKRKCFIEPDRGRGKTLNDFAALCAKMGKVKEAKMLYHSALRQWNPEGLTSKEPYPFLVVFQKDPGLVEWTYNPNSLIAAASILRYEWSWIRWDSFERREGDKILDEVLRNEPNWALPKIYSFFYGSTTRENQAKSTAALNLTKEVKRTAKTPREIEWIEMTLKQALRRWGPPEKEPTSDDNPVNQPRLGEKARRSSFLWKELIKECEDNWQLVAVPFIPSGYWNKFQHGLFGDPNKPFGYRFHERQP